MLSPGIQAPLFSLPDQDGTMVNLSAEAFDTRNCTVFGASFDTPAENKAFREAQSFAYSLLSDVDRSVGATYEVVRRPDSKYADYPERFSYLIDPSGIIARTYDVTEVGGHAAQVLADLDSLLNR
jgi:thioredoxin-dependent peroxiredoxin